MAVASKLIVPETAKRDPLIHRKINRSAVNKESIEAMTRETDHKVRGSFLNIEYPGQPGSINGKYYKDMEYFSQVMEDGKQYTIPYSVARFINERCCVEQHSYIQDANGNPLKTGEKKPRYKFIIEEHLK